MNGPTKKSRKGKSRSKRAQHLRSQTGSGGISGVHTERERRALRLIMESGLTPQNLPRLVEKNPIVAIECLILILTAPEESSSSHNKNEYLSALAGMDMSIHSMEVVNRLATPRGGEGSNGGAHSIASGGKQQKQARGGSDEGGIQPLLHTEYIHLYISTCISTCESMSYDRHLQNKSVRLLCVFLQSLIKNGIISVEVSVMDDLTPFLSSCCCMESDQPVHLKFDRIYLSRFRHFASSSLEYARQRHCSKCLKASEYPHHLELKSNSRECYRSIT